MGGIVSWPLVTTAPVNPFQVLNAIHTVVGLPQSDKRERKFLVDLEKCAPPEEWGVPYEDVLLEINFLRVKDKSRNIARIAKRSQRRTSSYIYSVKVVPSRAGVKPYVTERGVSAREYMNLLRYVDRKRNTVMKRVCARTAAAVAAATTAGQWLFNDNHVFVRFVEW